MTQSDLAIDVTSLRKVYRSGTFRRKRFDALRGVDLSVETGQVFGLLGPNGAGKTTVIKVLLGIIRKSSGTAHLLGRPVGGRASRRRVGYLPEHLRIAEHHTARSAMHFYGSLSGLAPRAMRTQIDELLERVGLADWTQVRVKKFSKGMIQRLGLAQALLGDPDLLILDEPTDGLDPVGRSTVRDILLDLKQRGKTVFLNSHLLQEVEMVCDRVAILDHGQVRREGTVDEITRAADGEQIHLELVGPKSEALAALDQYSDAVWESFADDRHRVTLRLADQEALDGCVDGLRQHGISLVELSRPRATLEDAFLDIIEAGRKTSEP